MEPHTHPLGSSAASRSCRRDIVIVDNFYDDPDAVVEYALSLDYIFPYDREYDGQKGLPPAWRSSRFRSARQCPFKSSKPLRQRLEFLTGEKIDTGHWNKEYPLDADGFPAGNVPAESRSCWWNCCFHVKHWKMQQAGEGVHSHTDHDTWSAVGADGWAGLIYLSKGAHLQSGLCTWRNKDPRRQHDWMTAPENWELVDMVGAVFNRLILHRGGIPHSGAPGWGNSLSDGRMFQTFFFRTRRVEQRESVPVSAMLSGSRGAAG